MGGKQLCLPQDALEKLMVGRTTITIAHRLSTVVHANKIAVVSKGSIIEQVRAVLPASDRIRRPDGLTDLIQSE